MHTKSDNEQIRQSCWNRAEHDEPMFILLGRDAAAPETLRAWVHERIARGENLWTDEQIAEALYCANQMWRWRNQRMNRLAAPTLGEEQTITHGKVQR